MANGYVVLSFFMCFVVAVAAVIFFVKYVGRKLQLEQEREHESQMRKKMRMSKLSRNELIDRVETESISSEPYITNYIFNDSKLPEDSGNMKASADCSHSNVNLILVDGVEQLKQEINTSDEEPISVEILASLFTNTSNSLPPTIIGQCCSPILSLFHFLVGFNEEAFIGSLEFLLTALLFEKRINEKENLGIMAKYEQLLYEGIPTEDSDFYTSKMHYMMSQLKREMYNLHENQQFLPNGKSCINMANEICKSVSRIQDEMIKQSCDVHMFDIFSDIEFNIVNCVVEKWINLETLRYRLNVIYDSTESYLKQSNVAQEKIQKILNDYIKNVYNAMDLHCKKNDEDLNNLLQQIKKEKISNYRQGLMDLQTQRMKHKSDILSDLESFNKKSLSAFSLSQIDLFIHTYQTCIQFMIFADSNSTTEFTAHMKVEEKKLIRSLKSCEEDLFSELRKDDLLSEEDLLSLSKTMTNSLKDFRSEHIQFKDDLLLQYKENILEIKDALKTVYCIVEKKYLSTLQEIQSQCLNVLHSLSNLEELEMNEIEIDFEIAFSSMQFCCYYTAMGEITKKLNHILKNCLTKVLKKDLSLSLQDMLSILKQDKNVLNRPSLFTTPDPRIYLSMKRDMTASIDQLSHLLEGYTNEFSKKVFNFAFRQCSEIVNKNNSSQSRAYFSNLQMVRTETKSFSIDNRGYTSSNASQLAKNYNIVLSKQWESQFDFKLLKMKENFQLIMKDFTVKESNFFDMYEQAKNSRTAGKSFHDLRDVLEQEQKVYYSLEKSEKSNSVKRVLDSNLENDLMTKKFGEKIESLKTSTSSSPKGLTNGSIIHKRNTKKKRIKLLTDSKQERIGKSLEEPNVNDIKFSNIAKPKLRSSRKVQSIRT